MGFIDNGGLYAAALDAANTGFACSDPRRVSTWEQKQHKLRKTPARRTSLPPRKTTVNKSPGGLAKKAKCQAQRTKVIIKAVQPKRTHVITKAVRIQAQKFTLSSPGGDEATNKEETVLNVNEVNAKADDHQLLMVPTTTVPPDRPHIKPVIRGRKLIQPHCQDGTCGQCQKCEFLKYWSRRGEDIALSMASTYGDKQCIWTARTDTGAEHHMAR